MWLITDWLVHSWELLQTRGWWFAVGLILCIIVTFLPLKAEKTQKNSIPFRPVLWGAALPVCNFAAVPLAVVLRNRGMRIGAVFAFLSAAVLLNPSGILSAWAYMGTELAAAWIFSAVAVSLAVGMAGAWLLQPEENMEPAPQQKSALTHAFLKSLPELSFWLVLGILAQALLQALMPENLWDQLLLDAEGASFYQAAAAGLFRHVCVPDDVALAASLVATGLRPGCAVLFLLLGICTNLPELFVLYGMAGKRTALLYALTTVLFSVTAAVLTQLLIGADFVPQFNLADAEKYTRIASLLSIRTWMPAKTPCALALLLLAGYGLWRRRE